MDDDEERNDGEVEIDQSVTSKEEREENEYVQEDQKITTNILRYREGE
jgi:hypothetical protein